ncbi:hypothetical protein B296_00020725 [Ensete ventricosum]|uniref:Uncharacterized protein n=1 Tax=Ensete ventricosum TaxID=4639 RepID=A0A426YTP4_ENSVE|nr:hypothetical protein B296_00020725 [Ensete ventricosum]
MIADRTNRPCLRVTKGKAEGTIDHPPGPLPRTLGKSPNKGGPNRCRSKKRDPTMRDNGAPQPKETSGNPNVPVARLASHSWDVAHAPPELDIISSDSTDSVREQLRQVNQRLDEVQREVVKSKEELDESSKGGSMFVP